MLDPELSRAFTGSLLKLQAEKSRLGTWRRDLLSVLEELTYLVVLRNDRVAKLLGAAAAPDPSARYVRLVFALCSLEGFWSAAGCC